MVVLERWTDDEGDSCLERLEVSLRVEVLAGLQCHAEFANRCRCYDTQVVKRQAQSRGIGRQLRLVGFARP